MIREIWGRECLALADALGDTPETTISVHVLRKGFGRAYIAGDPKKFKGAMIQNNLWDEEPVGHGYDPEILWELLQRVNKWFCVEVKPECARGLGEIIEKTGNKVKYYEDVYHALNRPVIEYKNEHVRQLTMDDLELIESSPEELRESCYESTKNLLLEGFAAGAVLSGKLVAVAHTSARTEKHSDIGVFALREWRNRGFVTAAASIVARRVQEDGQTPVWSTGEDNYASLRVAQKLGFEEVARWVYVIKTGEQ